MTSKIKKDNLIEIIAKNNKRYVKFEFPQDNFRKLDKEATWKYYQELVLRLENR